MVTFDIYQTNTYIRQIHQTFSSKLCPINRSDSIYLTNIRIYQTNTSDICQHISNKYIRNLPEYIRHLPAYIRQIHQHISEKYFSCGKSSFISYYYNISFTCRWLFPHIFHKQTVSLPFGIPSLYTESQF